MSHVAVAAYNAISWAYSAILRQFHRRFHPQCVSHRDHLHGLKSIVSRYETHCMRDTDLHGACPRDRPHPHPAATPPPPPPPHHTATEPHCTETHPNQTKPNRTAIQPPSHGFTRNSGNQGPAIAPRRRSGTIIRAEDGGIPREHRPQGERDPIRTPTAHHPNPDTPPRRPLTSP